MNRVNTKASMESLRWFFNYGRWIPSPDQWTHSLSLVQPEEKDRIKRFVFRRDAKAALAGRLLMRKAATYALRDTTCSYKDVKFGRTDKQKPFLINDARKLFSFNVSHHGDIAVLAAELRARYSTGDGGGFVNVGVDTMTVERPVGSKTVAEFFELMSRQFTEQEWRNIRDGHDEWEQLARFYRFWCLKESYVKALGVGIGYSLQRLDFHVSSTLDVNTTLRDTVVYVDGCEAKDWTFEETKLNGDQIICVALNSGGDAVSEVTRLNSDRRESDAMSDVTGLNNDRVGNDAVSKETHLNSDKHGSDAVNEVTRFTELSYSDLVAEGQPQTEQDYEDWFDFNVKDERPCLAARTRAKD